MPQGQIERRGERRFLIHWWSHWPEVAHERMAQALGEVEALRLELRIGPLAEGGIAGVGWSRDRRSWGNVERRYRATEANRRVDPRAEQAGESGPIGSHASL
jgi:hypothetical protein